MLRAASLIRCDINNDKLFRRKSFQGATQKPEVHQGSFEPLLDFMHCGQREYGGTAGSFASSHLLGLILHRVKQDFSNAYFFHLPLL